MARSDAVGSGGSVMTARARWRVHQVLTAATMLAFLAAAVLL